MSSEPKEFTKKKKNTKEQLNEEIANKPLSLLQYNYVYYKRNYMSVSVCAEIARGLFPNQSPHFCYTFLLSNCFTVLEEKLLGGRGC